jgi:parvulin-like peptidyl-prolyl isomerase
LVNWQPAWEEIMNGIARILVSGMVVLACGSARGELIDSIVAVVDQEVILLSDLKAAVPGEIERLRNESASVEAYQAAVNRLLMQTLEEDIVAKILYREALRASVVVDDKFVEQRIDQLRDKYDTDEAFIEYLTSAGETLSDVRGRTRKILMAQSMQFEKSRELAKNIVISEAEVAEFYEENKKEFSSPEQVRLRQIMIRSRRNSDERAEEKALMESVREQILAGADFGDMARKYSELDGATDGGIVGWQTRGELVQVLEDAAFGLDAGGISEVLELQFGVYLLMVDARREAGEMDFKEARTQIEPHLRELQAEELFGRWMNDLRKHSNVRIFLDGM